MTRHQGAQRLGQFVTRDRLRLDGQPRRPVFAKMAGISAKTLASIERGEPRERDPDTRRKLEDALGWQPGDFDRILAGAEPTPRERPVHITDRSSAMVTRLTGALRELSPIEARRLERMIDAAIDAFGHDERPGETNSH